MKHLLIALLFVTSLFAQDAPEKPEKKPETPRDNVSTTQHSIRVNGENVAYTAKAGTIIIKDEEGIARASMFFVSYTKDGADPATRPITYTFNGGPGSSSIWLHMGAFGPKRVNYRDDEGHAAAPPSGWPTRPPIEASVGLTPRRST